MSDVSALKDTVGPNDAGVSEDVQRTSPVWEAVMELERRHYTRREIAQTLRQVAREVEPDA